jgi:hypothetical protein
MKQLKQSLTSLAAAAALAGLTTPSRAVDYYATNSQSLQNALTFASADGANDNIYLLPGANSPTNFFTGNFNFNTAQNYNLTVQGAPGTTNTQIIIDGGGTGRGLNLTNSSITLLCKILRMAVMWVLQVLSREIRLLATAGVA